MTCVDVVDVDVVVDILYTIDEKKKKTMMNHLLMRDTMQVKSSS